MSLGDVLAAAKPREASVTICVAGDLAGEHDRLAAELQAERAKDVTSIAGNPRVVELAQHIQELEGRMKAAEFTFTFRALPSREWSDLVANHPPRDGHDERFNTSTLPVEVIKRCLIEPAGSAAEIDTLMDRLSDGAFDRLFTTAWDANRQGPSVPFSSAASAILSSTEPK